MIRVPADGPRDAKLLWVGEAPGRDEVLEGRPFVGKSGQIVRRTLRWAGIDDKEVRFSNVCKHNPGTFPDGEAGARLMKQYADELDAEIAEMPDLKVIVACGGPALTRLTGFRSAKGGGYGITEWRGSVLHNIDIPDVLQFSASTRHLARYPPDICIIPVLHPAGIMRSSGWDDMILFRRDVRKVADAINGTLRKVNFIPAFDVSPQTIYQASQGATRMYIDTEFNSETHQIFWMGLTFDGEIVYGFPWECAYVELVRDLISRDDLVKGAHYINAEVESLRASGAGDIAPPWYDTLIAMHALHPALACSLSDTARYYLDDVSNWKQMSHDDPYYNALDVAYGYACWMEQLKEARARPVDPLPEIEARVRLVRTTIEMTHRGMPVDVVRQRQMITAADKRVDELNALVERKVAVLWDAKMLRARQALAVVEHEYDTMRIHYAGVCDKHPTYNGIRKPAELCSVCVDLYAACEDLRKDYARLQKKRTKLKAELKRWDETGFVARNNEHLRWLLYSPDALKLPVQRAPKTRRPTANRTAIDKLATLRAVQTKKEAFELVLDIKRVQHLEKAKSTFLEIPLASDFTAHPPYKVGGGTRTGRLAGGKDEEERSDNRYAFNVLNIPREWRPMYVAPAGHILVEADWRNVEGRLTALFCKDPAYNAALDNELKGGPKVHAINAGIIYNIDPADAHTHIVMLSGQERPAYDGGKRLTHAWSYRMKPPHMSKTFNIEIAEAVRIDEALSNAYPLLVKWREELIARILGVWVRDQFGGMRCVEEGARFLSNPFGWQLHFMGMEATQANEVVAFLPQSTGASMWTRIAPVLEERYPVFTGTYDSFVLIVRNDALAVRECIDFLLATMEREWRELEGRTFPAEASVGYNWGKWSERNTFGLKEWK